MTAGHPPVPQPAATVVLLRPSASGLEVLLTKRPSTMAFGADLHVFPGGRVDAADHDPRLAARSMLGAQAAADQLGGNLGGEEALAARVAALRELFEEAGLLLCSPEAAAFEVSTLRHALLAGTTTFADVVERLDVRLRTDALVPVGHWTTPPIMPRRFDTWFFAAAVPGHVELSFDPREVVAHRWLTPRAALDAMASGDIEMWPPTSSTLRQLEQATSIKNVRDAIPFGPVSAPRVIEELPDVVRIVLSGAGAVPGQTVNSYVVGRRERVVVDPGDPADAAADAIVAAGSREGGRLVAIALTHVDPDHAAGVEALALRWELPIVAGPGAGRELGLDLRELADGEPLPGVSGWSAIHTPGPRPEHVAFSGPDGATLAGDLVGGRADRSILGPADAAALAASRARLDRLEPVIVFPGHGEPIRSGGK